MSLLPQRRSCFAPGGRKETKNEKDLHQIPLFPLREETAKDQGQKERPEHERILPSCRFGGQDHRALDGGTDRYL